MDAHEGNLLERLPPLHATGGKGGHSEGSLGGMHGIEAGLHKVKRRVGGEVVKAIGVDSMLRELGGEWKKRKKSGSLRGEMGKDPFFETKGNNDMFEGFWGKRG